MVRNRRWLVFGWIAFVCGGGLSAQIPPVVVSEYFNTSPLPVEEWTELLVVADTVDLRGYILTDNNQTQTHQQGGVRFRNVPLWERLRAGTIIVINHRGAQVVDADPRDGYIEIGAQNTVYFEPVRLDSNPGLSWEDVALNVALQGDILQLLDPQGRHVHALGHGQTPGPFFDSLPPPKVHHNGTCPNPGSVRVVPGLSLAAYAAGAGTDSTAALSDDVTKGLPNQSPLARDRNQLLWRSLRQPRWRNPQIVRAELLPTGVLVEWSAAEDPVPQDSVQGYLLVRDTLGQQSVPEDGRTYSPGERLNGGGIVIAHTFGSERQALDTFLFPCGAHYVYRVYAFRYHTDDRLGNAPGERLARGRSYNEDGFADTLLVKPVPPPPQVHASATEVCEGDSIVLWVDNPDTATYRYQWLLNGVPIVGGTAPRLVVRTGGRYAVELRTVLGCRVLSSEVEIHVHPLPQLRVYWEGDTLLCPGDTVILRAAGAWRYQWYWEGTPVDSGSVIRAAKPGRYWVVGWSQFGCMSTSMIELKQREITVVAEPAQVDFGVVGACEGAVERTVRLVNAGDTPLLLFRPLLPAGFAVVGQSFPVELGVGQAVMLRLRFAPPRSGVYTGAVRFAVQPCSAVVEISVRGEKQQGIAGFGVAEVDFGVEALCHASVRDTVLWLSNRGTAPVVAEAAFVGAPFQVTAPVFPLEVLPGDSVAIQLRYVPARGRHVQELAVAVRSGTCRDTLQATLAAITEVPQVQLSLADVQFPPLQGCQVVAETLVVIRNVGTLPVRVYEHPVPDVTIEGTPVELNPSESRVLRMRVFPSGQGLLSTEGLLVVEPCSDTLRLPVSVRVEGITAGLASGSLDFGQVVWCGEVDTFVLSLPFRTNAPVAELVGIAADGDTAAFSVSWGVGSQLRDGQLLAVRFHPPGVGHFQAQFEYRLRVDTCQLTQVLAVRGMARGVSYGIRVDGNDFGTVPVGQSGRRRLSLQNPNPFPMVLRALEGVVSPFAFGVQLQLPDTLLPGHERNIDLLYTPLQGPRWDTLWLQIHWAAPCDTTFTLVFSGASQIAVEPLRVQIELPPVVRAEPGEWVQIPITLASAQRAVQEAIRFLRLRLRYDWRLYEVYRAEGLLSGRMVQPGELVLEGDFPGGLPESARELARVVGQALWHRQMRTSLELSLDSLSGSVPLLALLNSGMLVVDSGCLAWQRNFGTGAATTIWVEPMDCPRLSIRPGSDEVIEVYLADFVGREVFRWRSEQVRHGEVLQFPLPCSSLAPGVYTVSVRQGTVWRALRFLFVR